MLHCESSTVHRFHFVHQLINTIIIVRIRLSECAYLRMRKEKRKIISRTKIEIQLERSAFDWIGETRFLQQNFELSKINEIACILCQTLDFILSDGSRLHLRRRKRFKIV